MRDVEGKRPGKREAGGTPGAAPCRMPRSMLPRATAGLMAAVLAVAGGGPGVAQPNPRGLPIIRDAEIEQLMRDYTAPILKAAGLTQQNVQVVLINQRSFNAFVIDGRRIFVNVGTLLDAKTPNEVIGVLAHEAGHIAGGHLSKMRQEMANMRTALLVGMLLGAGAMVAGARQGSSGLAQGGAAAVTAQPEMMRRMLLSYVRTQEEAADRAAVRFLNATGQSAKGMHLTFKRLAEQILFASQGADPYQQSHPMPRERVDSLAEIAKSSPHWDKPDPPALQFRHDMMRAKLTGFLEPPDGMARRYPLSDAGLPARYARAISAYRFSDLRGALAQIDGLIEAQPNNAYFHELKGQALLENGRAREALAPLRQAVSLAPEATLIRILLGQALVASGDPKLADEAIGILEAALAREPEVPDGYRQIAMAFGRKGDNARADLASAQAAFAAGEIKTARELAGRARNRFPLGSPGWVKADDIYSFKPPPGAVRPN